MRIFIRCNTVRITSEIGVEEHDTHERERERKPIERGMRAREAVFQE